MSILLFCLMIAAYCAVGITFGRGLKEFYGADAKQDEAGLRFFIESDPDIQTMMHGAAE